MHIVVVGLNLNIDSSSLQWSAFDNLAADKKIELMAARIEKICEDLKDKEPDSLWIIAWCERGISSSGMGLTPLSNQEKKIFKSTLSNLVKRYPNLVILAGSILISKHYDKLENALQLKSYYAETNWATLLEESFLHERKFRQHYIQRIENVIANFPVSGIDVFENNSYLFQAENRQKHGKILPANEFIPDVESSIFQPGHEDNANLLFLIRHPQHNFQFSIGVEICREHGFGVLQEVIKMNSLSKPLIQFVLSDSISLWRAYFVAPYVIHLDRNKNPILVVTNAANLSGEHDVVVYQHELLNDYKLGNQVVPKFHYIERPDFSLNEMSDSVKYLLEKPPALAINYELYFILRTALLNGCEAIVKSISDYQNFNQILMSEMYNILAFQRTFSLIDLAHTAKNQNILIMLFAKLDDIKQFTHAITLAAQNNLPFWVDKFIQSGGDLNTALRAFFFSRNRSALSYPSKVIMFDGSVAWGVGYTYKWTPLNDVEQQMAAFLLKKFKIDKDQLKHLFKDLVKDNDITAVDVILKSNIISESEIESAAKLATNLPEMLVLLNDANKTPDVIPIQSSKEVVVIPEKMATTAPPPRKQDYILTAHSAFFSATLTKAKDKAVSWVLTPKR